MQRFKMSVILFCFLVSCQAAHYLTIVECDVDRDDDLAIGECGGMDCDDQNGHRSSLFGEICGDWIDNNCNGIIDDGCACTKDGELRSCNIDSNGKVFSIMIPPGGITFSACKSGQQECRSGIWGSCLGAQGPQTELCDGRDNDCDGIIDNGFTKNTSCSVGAGSCEHIGTIQCNPNDSQSTSCDAQPYLPIDQYRDTPRNNSWDNNCNGTLEKTCCGGGSCNSCAIVGSMPIGNSCDCCTGAACCVGYDVCSIRYVCQNYPRINKDYKTLNCGDTASIFNCQCDSSCKVISSSTTDIKVNCK